MNEEKYLEEKERQLLNKEKHDIKLARSWTKIFPSKEGIYAIFDKKGLIYVGETGNIRERMKDLGKTYNHSLRRMLGKKKYRETATSKRKFSDDVEKKLNNYFRNHLKVSYLEVKLGRLELEERIIDRYKQKGIYNSKEKRKTIKNKLFTL